MNHFTSWNTFAAGMVKYVFMFFAAVACAGLKNQDIATASIALLASIDICFSLSLRARAVQTSALEQKLWLDHLTQRLFFLKLIEGVQNREQIEPAEIMKVSSEAAVADINLNFGERPNVALRSVAAIGTFIWDMSRLLAFYGLASWLGGPSHY